MTKNEKKALVRAIRTEKIILFRILRRRIYHLCMGIIHTPQAIIEAIRSLCYGVYNFPEFIASEQVWEKYDNKIWHGFISIIYFIVVFYPWILLVVSIVLTYDIKVEDPIPGDGLVLVLPYILMYWSYLNYRRSIGKTFFPKKGEW